MENGTSEKKNSQPDINKSTEKNETLSVYDLDSDWNSGSDAYTDKEDKNVNAHKNNSSQNQENDSPYPPGFKGE